MDKGPTQIRPFSRRSAVIGRIGRPRYDHDDDYECDCEQLRYAYDDDE